MYSATANHARAGGESVAVAHLVLQRGEERLGGGVVQHTPVRPTLGLTSMWSQEAANSADVY
jgi:hypothetical protein